MRDYPKEEDWGAHISKEQADYREGSSDERCGLCTMFRPPSSCTYVHGRIAASAVCDFFERK